MMAKLTLTFHLILFSFFVHANSPTTFWSESFSVGIPDQWTTQDLNGNGLTWEHCEHFLACPSASAQMLLPQDWFQSESFMDGYAFVAALESSAPNDQHQTVLTTPLINCEDQSEVFLRFNTLIFSADNEPEESAVVEVRAGSGGWVSYPVFPNFNEELLEERQFGFQSHNPHTVWLDLSVVAANQQNVQIRWNWKLEDNSAYFWGVDDIELFDGNPIYEKVVWGEQPGQGDFGGSLGDWSVFAPNNCHWLWDEKGLIDSPDENEEADYYVHSPTIHNGIALVEAASCGQFFTKSELISPLIDLSDISPGTALDLKFHQTGALGNPSDINLPINSIAISLDGGNSYSEPIEVNTEMAFIQVFSETILIPLPPEAAGNDGVRIKFIFDGNGVFWAIDDVRVVERHETNLAIRPVFFSVAANFSTPTFAVTPMTFSAEVENRGSATQDFSTIYVDVLRDADLQAVLSDTFLVGPLAAGEVSDHLVFDKKFSPPSWRNTYTCRYRIETNEPDEHLPDNEQYWKFEVSDTLFSKTKGPAAIHAGFLPNSSQNYEIGNCFFIPPGAGLEATGINFAFGNKPNLQNTNLKINLYQWKTDNSWGDSNQDTLVNLEEFEQVSINLFDIGLETSANDPLRTVYTVPISDETDVVPLEDSTYYFVTVGFTADADDTVFPIAGSEEIDYTGMYLQSFDEGRPQYVSVLKLEGENFFRVNSWGPQRIPYVELATRRKYTETIEVEQAGLEFHIFPNPTQDWLNIDLGETELAGAATVEVLDVYGRRVFARHIENGNVSHIPIGVSALSNGSYILRVVSGKSFGAKTFTVIKE